MGTQRSLRTVRFGHSPDPDDAFMFYGLASGKVAADGYEIVQVLKDFESLNRMALEGQLTYGQSGAHKVLDLGEWWKRETGLPLPLGGNAIRRDLGPVAITAIGAAFRNSIEYG